MVIETKNYSRLPPSLPSTDAQTVISFLKTYGLDKDFKVSLYFIYFCYYFSFF